MNSSILFKGLFKHKYNRLQTNLIGLNSGSIYKIKLKHKQNGLIESKNITKNKIYNWMLTKYIPKNILKKSECTT